MPLDMTVRGKAVETLQKVHLASYFRGDGYMPFAMTIFGYLMGEMYDTPPTVPLESVAQVAIDMSTYEEDGEVMHTHLGYTQTVLLLESMKPNIMRAMTRKLFAL